MRKFLAVVVSISLVVQAFFLVFSASFPTSFASAQFQDPYTDWIDPQGMVIYQIMVDRFYDGDPNNNDQGEGDYVPGNLYAYQGGDWQGIIDKMDYIKGLGVTAIWISPVVHNQSWGYHGYWAYDFYSPNPHFGTLSKLQELVEVAHTNGIKVIFDVIVNHTGDYLADWSDHYDPPDYRPAPPFDNADWYHHHRTIWDWENQLQLENWNLFGLDDLAQEIPEVGEELKQVYLYWINQTGCDGFRLDTGKHVPKWYWGEFTAATGIPSFGEVWHGSPSYIADYQNYMWSVLDFPMYYTIQSVFAYGGSCGQLHNLFSEDSVYPDPYKLVTFVDSHDVARFLNRAGNDYQKLKLALAFLMTARGIPCVYYGTEQGFNGGNDPNNREVLFNNFDSAHELYQYIRKLTDIRSTCEPLRRGTQHEMWVDDQVYAYSRMTPADEVIVVLNNSGTGQTREIPLRTESNLNVGSALTNLLDVTDTVVVTAGGPTGKQISVSLESKEPKIYAVLEPDFTVSVSPESGTVQLGGLVKATVEVLGIAGYDNEVVLNAEDVPDKVTVSFTPSSGAPDFESTLTISTDPTTPTGIYSITITGTGGGKTHSCTYSLTVTKAPTELFLWMLMMGIIAVVIIFLLRRKIVSYFHKPVPLIWR